MILVTVFLSILNQIEFHLVQSRKEKCQYDHISYKSKGNGNHFLLGVRVRRTALMEFLLELNPLKYLNCPVII